MSDEEQDQAILRIVKNRAEARKRNVLLVSELQAAGKHMETIGAALRHLSEFAMGQNTEYILKEIDVAPSICELGHVRKLVVELAEIKTHLAQLSKMSEELGI